jgi:hypothetical protein
MLKNNKSTVWQQFVKRSHQTEENETKGELLKIEGEKLPHIASTAELVCGVSDVYIAWLCRCDGFL